MISHDDHVSYLKADFQRVWGFSKGPQSRFLVYRISFGGWEENKRQISDFLVGLNLPGGDLWGSLYWVLVN